MTRKILVVDQDPEVIQALREPLREMGFESIAAEDGAVGLDKALVEKPSLILLDLSLPTIPGTELCVSLKRGVSTAHIPTIILSTRATEIDRIVGFEAGADDFIAKPFIARSVNYRRQFAVKRYQKSGKYVINNFDEKGTTAMFTYGLFTNPKGLASGTGNNTVTHTLQPQVDTIVVTGTKHSVINKYA